MGRPDDPILAKAIVSLGNLWMMKAVARGCATARVLDAWRGHVESVGAFTR